MMQDEEYYGKTRLWHEAMHHARVISIVECQPTADVVEVVRCKDCESYNGHRYCNYHADPVMDDDFCSYGEKMDGKGEGE